jgi:DNA repair protein RadD
MRQLRSYQQQAINSVRNLWKQGKRSTVLVAPTGAGKTAVAEEFIRLTLSSGRARVYFLAHATELVAQPLDRLRRSGFRVGAIKAGMPPDPEALVQVASTATIVRREISAMPKGTALVIQDEAQHSRSSTHMSVLDSLRRSHKTIYVILLTATPYRLDQRGLGDIADSLVELVTPSELIDAGYLLDPVCYDAPRDGEDPTRPKLIGDIVETWRKHSLNLPTICRAVNIAHSVAIAQRFRDAGIPAAHISGDMGDDERASLFARLAIGPTQSDGIAVLTTGGTMLEEGFDSAESYRHAKRLYPSCAYDPLVTLIDAAPTSSRGAWIQRLGRITRPYSTAQASADGVSIVRPKTGAMALVHTANLLEHGFLRDHHGFSLTTGDGGGKSGPSAPTPIVCKACLAMSPRSARACVGCGGDIAPGEPDIPREKAGELQQRAWSPPMAGAAEDRQLVYLRRKLAEVKRINCERMLAGMPPYKPGWAGAQFKMMFGDWPSRELMSRAEST